MELTGFQFTAPEVRGESEGGFPLSVQLHVHSDYSLLQSVLPLEKLVQRAKELGLEMLALTDHNTTAGHRELERLCLVAGIKPIFGLELSVNYCKHQALVVLIAKDQSGYGNLLRLASLAPPVCHEQLSHFARGLALLEGGAGSLLALLIEMGELEHAHRLDQWYQNVFGPDYYLCRQPGQNSDLVSILGDDRTVICQDVRYSEPSYREALAVLGKIGGFEARIPPDPLLSWAALQEKCHASPQAVQRTLELARSCSVSLKRERSEGADHADLRELARQGAKRRYPSVDPLLEERLEYELKTIQELGFSDYFLIASHITAFAKGADIPVGPGRGSAAGSLVAYCLGITEVDPLAWGLLFERFLNPDRQSKPDIDLDFCYQRRGEVLDHVAERFGRKHVAQIGTYGTFGPRSAEQEVQRVLGKKRVDLAEKIKGLKRHRSTHAAGVIITSRPVQDLSAVYSDRQLPVTHLDMYSLEELEVRKFDLLGLRTLTLLKEMEREIQRQRPDFCLQNIPLQDQAAFSLLGQGKTLGIFQLESELFQGLLRSMQPDSFSELSALLALGRPGPLNMFQQYLKNRRNPQSVSYLHPELKGILEETYGLILYQEQVILIAHKIGKLSLGEADLLRRALAKSDQSAIKTWREKFSAGAQKSGLAPGQAAALFGTVARFSGYAFNKAHSVSYATISWRMAYLKARYPLEFFLTMLNEARAVQKQAAYLLDCQSCGISVLPPSVVYSQAESSREGDQLRLGLNAVQGAGPQSIEAVLKGRKSGVWDSFSQFRREVKIDPKTLENLVFSGACDIFGARLGLVRQLGAEPLNALELLRRERELLGIYLSRHPAAAFLPLIRHFQGELEAVAGEILRPGVLDTPQGAVFFEIPAKGGKIEATGTLLAVFGSWKAGIFRGQWQLPLGPTLLISPKPAQLQVLKEILSGPLGRWPVVLRLDGGKVYHLLPPEFWVVERALTERDLGEKGIIFTWFDPWKECVS